MSIQSEKHSENEELTDMLNRGSVHELRSDLRRAKGLTVVITALAIVTHFVGVGFKESLICTGLSILSTFAIYIFICRFEKRMSKR